MAEKEIGKRIQQYRKKKGLTQEKLAEMINLSPNHLSAIERGVYGVKLDTLAQIINCIDCTADDLFADVTRCGYKIKASRLADEMAELSAEEQANIFDVVETMVRNAKQKK
ncbi:MAG: helix-turn-helix transcriptional regulator [Oscillospiraceae bacterium]